MYRLNFDAGKERKLSSQVPGECSPTDVAPENRPVSVAVDGKKKLLALCQQTKEILEQLLPGCPAVHPMEV